MVRMENVITVRRLTMEQRMLVLPRMTKYILYTVNVLDGTSIRIRVQVSCLFI